VAEYLLAEVLEQQNAAVRQLLLRTSVLERVNGELAELLTGDQGGERVLQDLEEANAFVVSLDPARTWFRYHQLFADLLQMELRRSAPGEVSGLHQAASGWFAAHGYPAEAIRHAQAAGDWALAARLLAGNCTVLFLDGQNATKHQLLAGFPAGASAADAELAAVTAEDELGYGSLEGAGRYLGMAERGLASVPAARRGHFQVMLGVVRLLVARQRGNLPTVEDQARRLQALAEAPQAALGEELRALALISLGITDYWTSRFDEAERQLDQGLALARRIGRPFLAFVVLAYQAAVAIDTSLERAAERSTRTVELASRHGWTDDPNVGIAYLVLATVQAWKGLPKEAELSVQQAERTIRMEADPQAGVAVLYIRALVELMRGQDAEALAALQTVERLAGHLPAPHPLAKSVRLCLIRALVRLGQIDDAEQVIAGLREREGEAGPARAIWGAAGGQGELRIVLAVLKLAQHDPHAALAALAPALDGSAPVGWQASLIEAYLLEAIARDALGDQDAAHRALERALDRAEPDGALLAFLLHPAPGLLERHTRRTAHAALIAEIQDRFAGTRSPPPPGGPRPPLEPLRQSELRVLRYLPTNLTAPEIAAELYVSLNTVKTHTRNLYAKLGTHRRAEAVARARSLGLLAPSALSVR
jgi:LuxR family maltose regulon positive regulatory protein